MDFILENDRSGVVAGTGREIVILRENGCSEINLCCSSIGYLVQYFVNYTYFIIVSCLIIKTAKTKPCC